MRLYHTKESAIAILFTHVLDSHHAINGVCYFDKKVAETILVDAIIYAFTEKQEHALFGDIVDALDRMTFHHEAIGNLAAKIHFVLSKVDSRSPIEGYSLVSEELKVHLLHTENKGDSL